MVTCPCEGNCLFNLQTRGGYRSSTAFLEVKFERFICFLVRLVVQRTKLIDETQEILLELLEEMTTGE